MSGIHGFGFHAYRKLNLNLLNASHADLTCIDHPPLTPATPHHVIDFTATSEDGPQTRLGWTKPLDANTYVTGHFRLHKGFCNKFPCFGDCMSVGYRPSWRFIETVRSDEGEILHTHDWPEGARLFYRLNTIDKWGRKSPFTHSILILAKGEAAMGYQQLVTVAKAGGDFTTYAAARASIGDAAANKIYLILMYPGEYNESIILKDYVDVIAIDPVATKLLMEVGDNNAECHCNIKLNIDSAMGYGLRVQHANSVIYSEGKILSSNNVGVNVSGGYLNHKGNIKSTIQKAALLTGGQLVVTDGTLVSTLNENWGRGIDVAVNTAILRNVSIFTTHAGAASISSDTANNIRCMGVFANRATNNITQLITGGITIDADVQAE